MNILVLNTGSTSLKYKLYEVASGQLKLRAQDNIKDIGGKVKSYDEALKKVLSEILISPKEISAIGHRIVHGGNNFFKPTKLTPKTIKNLENYNELAPLHNPPAIEVVKLCQKFLPQILNIGCFDTAFFKNLPEVSKTYGLPAVISRKFGIRRFGFHGLSHQYLANEAAKQLKKPLGGLNLITCHLGGGCSVTAIKNGKPIDTSMGFTPSEGLLMMTRAGDLDTGALFYIMEKGKLNIREAEDLLNHKSGLNGLSGSNGGFTEIKTKAAKGNKDAKLAIDLFVYRIKKYIGSYFAILGEVDAIVFSAGIVERNKEIAKKITSGLPFKVKTLIIPTDEEKVIGEEILKITIDN